MNKDLEKILRHLRLWGLLERWDEVIAEARKKRFSPERLLQYVLESEYRTKSENARILRRKRAHIPDPLEIETYPFQRQPKLDRKKIMSLYDGLDYMEKNQNIILLGTHGLRQDGVGHQLPAARD